MEQVNPFALVRASDYSDAQINSLWVEIGKPAIDSIIEPRSKVSKYILGGKGSGKTHLLRYYSYAVSRLRSPTESGIAILEKQKFLAIFLRATGIDASRFESSSELPSTWQQLFGVYLEYRLTEGVLEALCDIKVSSPEDKFDDVAFIEEVAQAIIDPIVATFSSIEDFHKWVISERRQIDDAVNNAAFTGALDVRVAFSIGTLCLSISRAIGKWKESLAQLPLIYLLDEIENFSISQQQVVNSLIRYGGGLATFRVSGRLYSRKTFATIADGEENREDQEFRTTLLDNILRTYPKYPEFARKFVLKRLATDGLARSRGHSGLTELEPRSFFDEISSTNYYADALHQLAGQSSAQNFIKSFIDTLQSSAHDSSKNEAREIVDILTRELPVLLQKLNLLIFCKKFKSNLSQLTLAQKIREDCTTFQALGASKKSSYATAYGHYSADLFAQLCRESKKAIGVPYAGFDTFVKMSSGNPRNLLIILGRAYAMAAFKGIDFLSGQKLSVTMQTEAAIEAARFMFEADTNFGTQSEQAREAVSRLALLLRTARFSLKIPEVSPLAVSFSEEGLSKDARKTLFNALNYSYVFEVYDGRPDRNSQRLIKKIQLNPLLSPRWELPVGRRGDLSLGTDLANAVFDLKCHKEFDVLLKRLSIKWNQPFGPMEAKIIQTDLF